MTEIKSGLLAYSQDTLLQEDAKQWFTQKTNDLKPGSTFHLTFGMVPRKVGKDVITLPEDIIALLQTINPEADQVVWSLDEWCRMLLLLLLPKEDRAETIQALVSAADSREQRVIYKSVQYLEQPEEFELMLVDGIRTNMIDVYDSIAMHNNFPQMYFKEGAWNQMVLKGIFMERPIYAIHGLDKRRNADLARIAIDFAHERWSAGRKVTPELWRLVVPYVDDAITEDLKAVVQHGDPVEQEAGIKAMVESNYTEAQTWLKQENYPTQTRGWDEIGAAIVELSLKI